MKTTQRTQPTKRRDTRTPVSVTHIGPYTVRVYDEEAYKQSIEQYSKADVPAKTGTPQKKRKSYTPFPKGAARFKWAS